METNRRTFIKAAGAAGAAMFAAGETSAQNAASPAAIRGDDSRVPYRTELFLDNQMLEATPGVSRRLHPAKKHLLNPVVRCDRWCDGNYMEPYTTMYDEEEKLFKMWARAGSDWKAGYVGGNAAYMLYFTSTDGVHWDKPDLGVMEVAGRRDHNIVFTSDMVLKSPTALSYGPDKFVVPSTAMTPQGKKAFFWGVNRHPHPRDASEKYIAAAIVQDHRRGAHIVTSPDGIHWSCAAAPFWQTPHDVSSKGDDCLMHLFFDEAKRKWVIYRRIIPEFSERMIANDSDRNRAGVDRYNRSYAYAESEDLKEWKNHRFILAMDADDPADTELYQFACHKFGRDVRRLHEHLLSAPSAADRYSSGDEPRRNPLHPRLPGDAVHPLGSAGILRLHGDGLLAAQADRRQRHGLHLLRGPELSARCRHRAAIRRFRPGASPWRRSSETDSPRWRPAFPMRDHAG